MTLKLSHLHKETIVSNIPSVQPAKAGLHPIIWIAAVAVILFSAVGIASMTGLLGKSAAPEAPPTVVAATEPIAPPPPPMPEAAPLPPAPVQAAPAPVSKPVEKKPAKPVVKHTSSSTSSAAKSSSNEPVETYSSKPAPPPPCPDCATITAITPIKQEGEGTGLGAIAGGVLGGVLGNQIGGGSGRDIARIAGIAGGAYAGHQVEKSQRAHTVYDIRVRFSEDGSTHTLRETGEPVWEVGDKVRVVNGKLVPR